MRVKDMRAFPRLSAGSITQPSQEDDMVEAATKMPVKSTEKETEPAQGERRPLAHLRQEIDRLFEDFHSGSWRRPLARTLFDVEPFWRGDMSWALHLDPVLSVVP
jgi:hypothetical protein